MLLTAPLGSTSRHQRPDRLAGTAGVAGAHILLVWALLDLEQLSRLATQAAPLMVALLPSPAVEPATPATASAGPERAALAATPAATSTAPPAPSWAATPAPMAPVGAQPPPRRQLPASAVAYRVLPPVEVPRASRHAGESGTVWLRVVVDAQGAPALVALHRSSGFARLDEQALWAMRQARFKPHTEDGQPVEVEVIAPIEYPAE